MAATVDGKNETNSLSNNNKPSNKVENSLESSNDCSKSATFKETSDKFGGYDIDELYSLAKAFLKEKEGKAFQISYTDKSLLVAFSQQVSHGQFVEEKAKPLGYLDFIGRDRRQAWQNLGNMPQKDAKANFINLLHNVCPLFRPFVLAHKCDLEEKERKRKEEEELRWKMEEEERLRQEEEKMRLEEEEKMQEEREKFKQNHQKDT